jgi:glycosyltransferase involved in cell wall biosynthesis
MLWVGDAACPSGFARSTHGVLDTLRHEYAVTVLGINYNGDPHPYSKLPIDPYEIYACAAGGDAFGVKRLIWMCDLVKPDIIVIQQDPWNFPYYLQQLAKFPEYRGIPVIGVVAVDGKNCRGKMLNGLSLAIFWTQFGLDEARLGGYTGPAVVVPLGVDLDTYYQIDKQEARIRRGLPPEMLDSFIVGTVNRNQPRKRFDLMIEYFAEWQRRSGIEDAFLWIHAAPTGDTDGIDCVQYAEYHNVKLAYVAPPTFYGLSDDMMRDTYNVFDVVLNTSQGEGFGLTTFEAMACGVPVIASDWSALGELCKNAAYLVPCSGTSITMSGGINSIGGVMDKKLAIAALDNVYINRQKYVEAGLARVWEDRFRWENVGRLFSDSIEEAMGGHVAREVREEAMV